VKLSAIIPTHERPNELRDCLGTLLAQDLDSARFEVVVVDDGSTSDVAAVVAEQAASGAVRIRCERRSLGGLNAGRNHGAAVAEGDVLAFLDDDTLVSPGWARAMLSAFERHPVAGVGGRVELALAAPAPSWLAPRRYYLAEYDLGENAAWLIGDPVPVGANCAVRREDFARIGGFHSGLDRLGRSLVSNGDTEFFRRLRAAGGSLRYEPAAWVLHRVPAERLTIDFFVRRHYAQGISDELMSALEHPNWTARQRVARLARDLGGSIAPQVGTVIKDLLRGRGTVNAHFFACYWRGRFAAMGKRQPI
jgi:GT2 family glycosyltransferase